MLYNCFYTMYSCACYFTYSKWKNKSPKIFIEVSLIGMQEMSLSPLSEYMVAI